MNKNFKNLNILITGGTGSFGNQFVATMLKKFNFKKLAIFSRDELKQYEMSQKYKDKRLRFLIGDIRDTDRIDYALKDIDIVVHAAALKHVPIAEYNPSEFIKTNIIGSENVIKASIKNNVKRVISLSTDKAASPINLYGATKLVADKLFSSANNMVGSKNLIFSSVRYGNVINSRGSIIPLFKKLRSQKKPLTITNVDTTRFFLSLEEGVNFVINCLSIMKGGEIFVPKIRSVKITDLANVLYPDAKIQIIGMRPGEKIHEVLISSNENNVSEFSNFYVIHPTINLNKKINYEMYNKMKGHKTKENFQYESSQKKLLLNKNSLKQFLKKLDC